MKCIIETVSSQTLIKNHLTSAFRSVIQVSGQHKIIIFKYSSVLLCEIQAPSDVEELSGMISYSLFLSVIFNLIYERTVYFQEIFILLTKISAQVR